MTRRGKPLDCPWTSWDECGAAVARMARLQAERDAITARLEAQIAAIRDRALPRQNELSEEYAALEGQVEAFAAAHRADFGEKKSVELSHGTLSFRTTPPSVRLLNRKWTWDQVCECLLQSRLGRLFIRRSVAVDKEAVLSAYREPDPQSRISDEDLAALGMKIAQDEEFTVALKTEALSVPVSQEPANV